MLRHRGSIRSVAIHVMPVADLARAAVAATVVGHDAVALSEEEQQLGVPVVRAERPTLVEVYLFGVFGSPVLVEYVHPILCCHERHGLVSLFLRESVH